MSEMETRLHLLAQAADADVVAAIGALLRTGPDPALNRVNVFDFAERHNIREEKAVAGFLHAARVGLFDLAWNILCPGCGGVLNSGASMKSIRETTYNCSLCAAGYEPSLDDMVEVSFMVNPRVRRIAAHDPDTLPIWDYSRQMFWSSGIELPEGEAFDELIGRLVIDAVEIAPGEKMILSIPLPEAFVILFDPVSHAAHFLEVAGAPTRERQDMSVVFDRTHAPTGRHQLRPGPVRFSFENRTDRRVLPGLYIAGDELHHLLGHRRRYLTGKQLVTNQTFNDIFRTSTIDVDQRLKLTSLTFLFTDLKGSTAFYEAVGDLVAYDLVKAHFRVLEEIVAAERGCVVKTIGDAVMATFPTPDRGVAASLKIREAMHGLNASRRAEDLVLKMGLHEGPCLAVALNDRLDYFGQTVNIAARVQGLAQSQAIYATEPVVVDPASAAIIAAAGLSPVAQTRMLRGIGAAVNVYEIP
jgi:class 3 adenylate cyclase